jgi:hypothetical protein
MPTLVITQPAVSAQVGKKRVEPAGELADLSA